MRDTYKKKKSQGSKQGSNVAAFSPQQQMVSQPSYEISGPVQTTPVTPIPAQMPAGTPMGGGNRQQEFVQAQPN